MKIKRRVELFKAIFQHGNPFLITTITMLCSEEV